jgi:glycosyltransferase involved in cell wall biosynthesis
MTTDQPLVSIVIPAYNQARYLRQSVESALGQSYAAREIIVVDDGSTDETAAVAESYGSQITLVQQENRGLAGARNAGIRVARGEWVGLLDADDIWLPHYLATMMNLAAHNPQADVLYCRARSIDTAGNDLKQVLGGSPVETARLYGILLHSNFIIPSTVTLRRNVVVDAGYFDQSLRSCEDWDLWLRILPGRVFAGTGDILVRYRVHDQSLSANVAGMHTAKKAVVEKHFGIDDGLIQDWPPEKKSAYTGLYRYYVVTSVLRKGDWQAAGEHFRKVLLVNPAQALDLGLFYELALGTQPVGYRGTEHKITLETNAKEILKMLDDVFTQATDQLSSTLRRQAYGTACYAIGLCAHNIGQPKISLPYLLDAGKYRPEFYRSAQYLSMVLKSSLGRRVLNFLSNRKSQ